MPIHRSHNKSFFKKWSSEMAYVVGFICADGNIVKTKRNTHFLALYSADQSLLEEIRHVFGSTHIIAQRSARSGAVFRLQIGSREWYEDLCKIGIGENKSRRMSLPLVPKKYFNHFLRGYFDGDGNVWAGFVHTSRTKPVATIRTSFTCASEAFIHSLQKRIAKEVSTQGGAIYSPPEQHFSRLTYSKEDTLKIYKFMYNAHHKLYLPRKKKVFKDFVNCGRSSTG